MLKLVVELADCFSCVSIVIVKLDREFSTSHGHELPYDTHIHCCLLYTSRKSTNEKETSTAGIFINNGSSPVLHISASILNLGD